MTQEDIALALLQKGNGYLTAKEAQKHGVAPYALKRLADRGQIERVSQGLYIRDDVIPDPFYIMQRRCSKGVFSHETALFFHDLSDRNPLQLMMTIPSGDNTRLFGRDDTRIFYCKPKFIRYGAGETATSFGHTVMVYDTERTLCDCLRSIDQLDKDLVLTALKRYMKDPARDKAKLLENAATFKIRDIVLRYMEVLS